MLMTAPYQPAEHCGLQSDEWKPQPWIRIHGSLLEVPPPMACYAAAQEGQTR